MKTREALQTTRRLFIVKCVILTLLMSALFAMPVITLTVHAFGHTVHYNAFAVLAEQDMKMKELQAQKKKNNMATTAAVQNEVKKNQTHESETKTPYTKSISYFTTD